MPLIIGGIFASVLGIAGLLYWFREFLAILAGALPIVLILGGILAIYVGYDDMQEKAREEKQKREKQWEEAKEELEQVKAKTAQYEEELSRLKKEGTGG